MAPEQAAGEAVGPRSDLFSLGGVLYRMCTGEMAFQEHQHITGDSVGRLASDHSAGAPAELNRAVPPAMSDLILRLLAKKLKRPAAVGSSRGAGGAREIELHVFGCGR